jgi:hypothetical protein
MSVEYVLRLLVSLFTFISSIDGNMHVLENHHVETALGLARTCGLLASLERKQQDHVEDQLRACVLATDMAAHGELSSSVVSSLVDRSFLQDLTVLRRSDWLHVHVPVRAA